MNYPNPEDLRAQAARLEAQAPAIADASEYPRTAAWTVRDQVAALRNMAETVENVGRIAPKRPGMTGEERRQRRADILRLRSARLAMKAADHQRSSHDIGSRIPFGQPILVGHHSERGHRRAIDRMHRQSAAAYSAGNYAAELERRADSVEASHAISASDSDAVSQYARKLESLKRHRDHMKETNAAWRRYQRSGNPTELETLGFTADKIETLKLKIATAYSWEKQPFPSWQITNLGATIRDTQKKLESAKARFALPEISKELGNGITLEDSPGDNRLRLFFPGKPAAEVRAELKRHGFRWAPSLGCWQAYRNWRAQEYARGLNQKVPANIPAEPLTYKSPALLAWMDKPNETEETD